MKTWPYAVLLAALLLAWGTARWLEAAPETRVKPTVPFMRQKLLYTQGLTEGLVTENYRMIMNYSRLLNDMTVSNLWSWMHQEEYVRDMRRYQDRAQDLVKASRQANLEKATRAYHRLVESCVDCHRHFRLDQRRRELLED